MRRTGNRIIIASRAVVIVLLALTGAAQAADCPRPDTLGTLRVLAVDAKTTPQVGLRSFSETLPLDDKEVVLTFDDGPFPPITTRVLAALAHECVQATFFLIGKNAAANPTFVRKIAAEGHSIGHHSWSHRILNRIKPNEAIDEIDHGIAADEAALHGATAAAKPTTPFFRFPGFASTPALLELLQSRGIVAFGADFWISDWNPMTPQEQLRLAIARVEAARKGIILFHDTKAQTAAMLPEFLRYLRENHFRVVHLVAGTAGNSGQPALLQQAAKPAN